MAGFRFYGPGLVCPCFLVKETDLSYHNLYGYCLGLGFKVLGGACRVLGAGAAVASVLGLWGVGLHPSSLIQAICLVSITIIRHTQTLHHSGFGASGFRVYLTLKKHTFFQELYIKIITMNPKTVRFSRFQVALSDMTSVQGLGYWALSNEQRLLGVVSTSIPRLR